MNERTFLNRARTFVGTDAAYLTRDSVEIDSSQAYSVFRRRVFFDDVSLVTLHRERGWPFVVVTGVFGTFCLALAIFIIAINVKAWAGALPFVIVGFPAFIACLVRLAMGRSVVTVFGRRTRAVLRFSVFRSQRARAVYGQLCSAVRRAQSSFSAPESPERPLPSDVPLPPPEQ